MACRMRGKNKFIRDHIAKSTYSSDESIREDPLFMEVVCPCRTVEMSQDFSVWQ